jgi:hypothetical protein
MGRCSCGADILSNLGQGFIITSERRIVWMRRRSDTYSCPDCGRMFDLDELIAVVGSSNFDAEATGRPATP